MNLMLRLIQGAIDMKLMIAWAVTSSALTLIVLAVRHLFREKLSARLRYALWGVVLLRLLLPFQMELPAAASDALPVLAANAAQKVTPWLDDTLLYAVPAKDQPTDKVAAGMPPQYARNGFYGDPEYYSGGIVYNGENVTRYAFMLSALEVVVLIWIAGTVLTALVILASNLRFGLGLRKRREPLDIPDAPILVYTVEGLPSPCLFGVFKPAVYVTPDAAGNPDTLRHVLAHELTHYAHFDHIWSLLRCLALALHWYNPLVWLAVGLSKADGELACDEGAVARLGESERIPYGRTLVDMVAKRSLRPADLLSCSTAMTGGGKFVKRRVARLVQRPKTVKAALFAAVAVVALSVVFVFAGRAQPKVNTMFQDQLDLAASIRYSTPAYFSQFYSSSISDPDLLAAAKEALSGFTYLDSGDPSPDLQKGLISTSRIALINDSAETPYTLLWQDGRSYLFPGDMWEEETKLQAEYGERAHIQGVSGIMQAKPGIDVASALESLARQQRSRSTQARQEMLEDQAPAIYEAFLDRAEGAVSIQIEEGTAKSPDELGPITGPEWLEEARTALLAVNPLPGGASILTISSEEQLRHEAGDGLYAITLTDQAGGTAIYYIDRRSMANIDYLVFPMWEYPAEDSREAVSFCRVGVLPGEAGYALHLAAKVSNGIFPPPTEQAKSDLSGLTIHR